MEKDKISKAIDEIYERHLEEHRKRMEEIKNGQRAVVGIDSPRSFGWFGSDGRRALHK